MLKYAYPISAEDRARDYRCANCKGPAEYKCLDVSTSSIVVWRCGHCILELYGFIGRFIRDTVLKVDDRLNSKGT